LQLETRQLTRSYSRGGCGCYRKGIPIASYFAASTINRPLVFNPEVFDLDAYEFQEFSEPVPVAVEQVSKSDRLSSRARLQMIASILAMAVLRRKARMTMNDNVLSISEESLPGSREGLDLSRK